MVVVDCSDGSKLCCVIIFILDLPWLFLLVKFQSAEVYVYTVVWSFQLYKCISVCVHDYIVRYIMNT